MRNCQQVVQKTKDLLKSKDFTATKEELTAGLEKFPNQINLLTIANDAYRASGDLEMSLEFAERLISHHPGKWQGYGRAAQDLVALERFKEAQAKVQAGLEKFPNQINLLTIAYNAYRASGDREKSLEFAELLISHHPNNCNGYLLASQDKLSLGLFNPSDYKEKMTLCPPPAEKKQLALWNTINDYQHTAKSSLWINSYKECKQITDGQEEKISLPWQPFQYWSQGSTPNDVAEITEIWNKIFTSIGVSPIQLFDNRSALLYIEKHCPELSISFKTAFHYTVESDIFRIAYAQKNNCIWLDSDLYPKQGTKNYLKALLVNQKTTLLFRWFKPTITSGFFIAPSSSDFFTAVLKSTKHTDFSILPQNKATIFNTFGPRRFNIELDKILKFKPHSSKSASGEELSVIDKISFVNDHIFTNINPPYKLRYKLTSDSWHGLF